MMICQMMFGMSFYGVMVILTRFFLEDLNYSEADTMMVVGAFSAIGPLFAIAGGFITDKFLGAYRSLTLAFVCFAAGYGLLVLGASLINVPLSLAGIALASYARGLMFPSYSPLFKRTFATEEAFESGYAVNYSINNIGAFISQYLFPLIVLVIGFSGSYLLCAGMALLAFVLMLITRKPLLEVSSEIDRQPVSIKNWVLFLISSAAMIGLVFFMFSNMDIGKNIVYAIGLGAIGYFISIMVKSEKRESLRMGTILIMVLLTIAFFVYYGQMMTSMTLVTINTMRGDLFGIIPIAPEASMAMNPMWCMVAGPLLALAFSAMEKRNIHFTIATKVGFAFIFTAIAFGILTLAVMTVGSDVIIRPEVFLVIHFFLAFAEVIVGSMVVAFILSVAPKHIEAFSVSLFSVATALSGVVGAVFSTSIAVEKGQAITQEIVRSLYGDYFGILTIMAVVMVGVAFAASKLIKKMLANDEDPTQGLSEDKMANA
ncbi:putative transport protein, PTR2 family [Shewanella sediminis HAW-EB3]|uniref:Putative transport protein, PTR2 family n=1 Tax=Shewanella sediminis (strain HAW-EB3) TaxID=425104 RepID=A8FTC8_SHESH|nr:MFS transporter [Shewanella sediminis]ABV36101.1 putative transport protein, PTR2 family [Shewanella sediminis HAW-EB3]